METLNEIKKKKLIKKYTRLLDDFLALPSEIQEFIEEVNTRSLTELGVERVYRRALDKVFARY